MMKKIITMVAVAICSPHLYAQTFSTEFSAEIQKAGGQTEVAPQLKAILELPLRNAWAVEMELASSQAGLDYRIDTKRELNTATSFLAGLSSGDACRTHFADIGMIANLGKTECTAVLHYAPFTDSQDKYLELTAQRSIGSLYLQPGLYINHASSNVSLTGVLTLGISLDIQ